MTSHRTLARRTALPVLLFACVTVSACGVRFETIAAPPPLPAPPGPPFAAVEPASLIFTPCIPGDSRPHASSEIGNLLLGKDPFADNCGHRANAVARPVPAAKPDINADLVVTDELVSAVLTGTGEYWHQPVIGPA